VAVDLFDRADGPVRTDSPSTIADAILDRIVHNSYRIVIAADRNDSVSMRQRKGLTTG